MKLLEAVIVVAVLVGTCGLAEAHEEAGGIECEHAKLATEDASTLDPGAWEVTLSYDFTTARRAFDNDWDRVSRGSLREHGLGLTVARGIVDNLHVGLSAGYASVRDREEALHGLHGWTDVEVGAKWRFYHDPAARLEIAYTPALSLPVGEDDVTDDFFTLTNGIAVTKDWTDRWTSNFALGTAYAMGGHRDDLRWTLAADAALGYQLTKRIQPVVELNYAHDVVSGDSDADVLAATAGFIICLKDGVRLNLGVQQALAGRNADAGTTLMAALTFAF